MTTEMIYQPRYANSFALIIGINAYQNAPPLGYARNDAESIARILVEKFGFIETNITPLNDEQATREHIIDAFLEYTKDHIGKDDRIIVFFAGHGYTRTGNRGEIGYLVPVDGTSNDLTTLIRWDDLTRNSELINAKHILFVMDACYGGLAVTRHMSPGSMRFAKDMLQRYSRQVLTAGKADEVVADSGGPRPNHSIFTGHLLDALEGASVNEDGLMTANSVMAYVYDRVAKDYQSRQTPHYGYFDGDGDFIFNPLLLEKLSAVDEVDKDILIEISPTLKSPATEEDQALSDGVKSYLSDPKDKIRLDDLVTGEIRRVLYEVGDKKFQEEVVEQEADLAQHLKHYEYRVTDLQKIVILIAKWGTEEHRGILEKLFSRIAESSTGESGREVRIRLNWYPTMLLLYAGGISSLSDYNYGNLATILKAPVGTKYSGEATHEVIVPTVEATLEADRRDLFKKIPGHERHYVPRSEYLFKILQPPLEDLLFLGRSYELLFDKFEVFYALVYADLTYEKRISGFGLWGPPGRFGWKYGRSYEENPLTKILAEAAQQQESWGPIKAGLFQGSYSRFKEISEKYKELISRLNWF
jgi:hypothetical protein